MTEFENKKELITDTLSEMRIKTLDKDELWQESELMSTQDSIQKDFITERDAIPDSKEKIKQILSNLDGFNNKDERINEFVQKSALLAVLYDLDIEYKFSFSNIYKTLHIKVRSQIDNNSLTKNQKKDLKKYNNIPEKRSGNLGIAKGFINFKNGKPKEIKAQENMAFSIFNSVGVNGDGTLTEEMNNLNEKFVSSPRAMKFWKYYETVKKCGQVGNIDIKTGVENNKNKTWRFNDSECKIIEKITTEIDGFLTEDNNNGLLNGKIEIFTERPPCRSCKEVMKKFTSDYESIIIDVIDGYGNKLTIENGNIQE